MPWLQRLQGLRVRRWLRRLLPLVGSLPLVLERTDFSIH